MLNVDESIAHVDNKSKILQKSSVLKIQNARFTPASLSGNARSASNTSPVFYLPQNVSLAFLPASEHKSHVSGPKCETHVLRHTQPTPEAPFLLQNVRPAFYLLQSMTPTFLTLNAMIAFVNTMRGPRFNKETRDPHSDWHVFKT